LKFIFDFSFNCKDATTAGRLKAVLTPDNKGIPKTQEFSMILEGPRLKFRVESDRVMPGMSTVESVLSDAALFDEMSQTSI